MILASLVKAIQWVGQLLVGTSSHFQEVNQFIMVQGRSHFGIAKRRNISNVRNAADISKTTVSPTTVQKVNGLDQYVFANRNGQKSLQQIHTIILSPNSLLIVIAFLYEFLKSQSLTRLLVYRLQNFEILMELFGMHDAWAVFEQGLDQMTNHSKYFDLKSNRYI